MSLGLAFWIIMLLVIIFNWPNRNWGPPWAGSLVLIVLLFLLGWKVFGFPIHG